jgi:hypothetical protein
LSQPEVYVRPADAGHLNPDQDLFRADFGRNRIAANLKRLPILN